MQEMYHIEDNDANNDNTSNEKALKQIEEMEAQLANDDATAEFERSEFFLKWVEPETLPCQ